MKKRNLILYELTVAELRSDAREYRQNSVVYTPQRVMVGCLMEINPKNFVNVSEWYKKYLLWELGTEEFPELPNQDELILTPQGLKILQDQLEKPYVTPETGHNDDLTEGEEMDF